MTRIALILVGSLSVGLGVLGIFLPVLPTTPFLLLAAGCFTRSSPYLHQKLLSSPLLGKIIHQWESERTIPRRARNTALLTIIVSFGISILFVIPNVYGQLTMALIGLGVMVFICRIPVTR